MIRRTEIPIGPHDVVWVAVLGSVRELVCGEVVELSGTRLHLMLAAPLSPGELVRIDAQECLMLGETLWCDAWENTSTSWIVGVNVRHAVWDVPEATGPNTTAGAGRNGMFRTSTLAT